jgi:hypothetical protein
MRDTHGFQISPRGRADAIDVACHFPRLFPSWAKLVHNDAADLGQRVAAAGWLTGGARGARAASITARS